jgi:hypothetical protein
MLLINRKWILPAFLSFLSLGASYPPDTQLVFNPMPVNIPMPGYLSPYIDPMYHTLVTRIADKAAMKSDKDLIAHHYAKDQPWNADGSLISLSGWPSAILDGKTYAFLRWITPPGEHHTWSNLDPSSIYSIQPPNVWVKVNAVTNKMTIIRTFTEYSTASFGAYEGNLSKDDKFVALQCKTTSENWVVVYDIPNDRIVSRMNIGNSWPDNVSMSQSGDYIAIQWGVSGSGDKQGTDLFTRDFAFVRKIGTCGGCHFDLGYDTDGHEVAVIADIDGSSRAILSIRFDNGQKTVLLTDSQMSWYIHISCRSLNRPGWAYLTEFADPNSQTKKPNYQVAFGVKLDGSGTVECFAHVHHSTTIQYEREPFGVPNRDGAKMMFRSDWENGTGPIYGYIAEMPGENTSSVGDKKDREIGEYNLYPLYPNPFNSSTTIRYAASSAGKVEIAVYDATGQKVRLLEKGSIQAGEHTLLWNGTDERGQAVGSGVYIFTFRAGSVMKARRMVLMR